MVNAYSGSLLHERGEYETAELFHFAYNAMPLLASFVIIAAPGWVGARKPIAVSAIVTALGLGGFIRLDGWWAWEAAMIVGFVSTIELILLVSLPPAIAKGIAVSRLSAGMTLIAFAIAFLLTLLGGWMAAILGGIELSLVPALIFMVLALGALGKHAIYPKCE